MAYYGLFKMSSDNHVGTLVRTPDVVNSIIAPAVQTTSDLGWNPDIEGAVAIKLVDPAQLASFGYAP